MPSSSPALQGQAALPRAPWGGISLGHYKVKCCFPYGAVSARGPQGNLTIPALFPLGRYVLHSELEGTAGWGSCQLLLRRHGASRAGWGPTKTHPGPAEVPGTSLDPGPVAS